VRTTTVLVWAALVALCVAGSAAAFANNEPLASDQWYLEQDQAWSFWSEPPQLKPVKIAVIDSGIDSGHPEFAGRIAGGRSFVPGSWQNDTDGHGTFVAGEIAADPFNSSGIAGLAFNAQLLIAKVVEPDGSVSLQGEVAAIRWAVDAGAKVINLSLGGVRDPLDPQIDSYSSAERSAVDYAHSKGVVIVAAVGNGPESPATPWRFADYPAALPHVIGVSALRENGSVPDYSNRDLLYVDLSAPGDAIFSTIPRNLVDSTRPTCVDQPYSDCGPLEFRDAIGTSFAAPQVSAAAALLLGQDPSLTPDAVAWILERTATDVNPSTGCTKCAPGRDQLTGWGRLNVRAAMAALQSRLPPPDAYEPNDDAGSSAHAFGAARTIWASVDYWDDAIDVYSLRLSRGESLYARLSAGAGEANLVLWKPGTDTVVGLRAPLGNRTAVASKVGAQERLAYIASVGGVYFLEVKDGSATRLPVTYRLSVATKSAP
jgi:subtilisin family serine protease